MSVTETTQNFGISKQSDTQSIITSISHHLKSKGITVKAGIKNNCLQLMLEAKQVPDRQTLVEFIRTFIPNLKAESIRKVKVYGRQIGEEFPIWNEEFDVVAQTLPSWVELAKLSNVNAIATLIGQWLNSQNTAVKVSLESDCLQIMLESAPVLEQQVVVPLIQNELISLSIPSVKRVKIYGKETNEIFPDWNQEIDLATNLKTQVIPNPPPLSTRLAKTTILTPDSQRGTPVWRCVNTLRGHLSGINSIAFSPDGQTLSSGSNDKTIKIWQLSTGEELGTLTGHSGWFAGVRSVAISLTGQILASGSDDNTIKLWQIGTDREIRTLTGHTSGVASVAISPDGQTLVSSGISYDNTIKLWQISTGRQTRTFTAHTSGVYSVAISSDGQTIASGGEDKTVRLWRLDTGDHLRTLAGHSSKITSVVFSPNQQVLVSGSDDKTIRLWHVNSGELIRTLTGHSKEVTSVAFSPDGQTLASSSVDNTIKLWKLDTGDDLRTLTGHSNKVTSVAFSPDGQTLASGSDDKTIMIWRCD